MQRGWQVKGCGVASVGSSQPSAGWGGVAEAAATRKPRRPSGASLAYATFRAAHLQSWAGTPAAPA